MTTKSMTAIALASLALVAAPAAAQDANNSADAAYTTTTTEDANGTTDATYTTTTTEDDDNDFPWGLLGLLGLAGLLGRKRNDADIHVDNRRDTTGTRP